MHLIPVPADEDASGASPVKVLWPMVAPLIEKAIEYSDGMVTLPEVVADLLAKRAQCWVVVSDDKKLTAAAISCIRQYESGLKQASIRLIGGENLKAWFGLKTKFEEWAKSEGCSEVLFHVRKGWIRELPDYQLTQYVMRKKLD